MDRVQATAAVVAFFFFLSYSKRQFLSKNYLPALCLSPGLLGQVLHEFKHWPTSVPIHKSTPSHHFLLLWRLSTNPYMRNSKFYHLLPRQDVPQWQTRAAWSGESSLINWLTEFLSIKMDILIHLHAVQPGCQNKKSLPCHFCSNQTLSSMPPYCDRYHTYIIPFVGRKKTK